MYKIKSSHQPNLKYIHKTRSKFIDKTHLRKTGFYDTRRTHHQTLDQNHQKDENETAPEFIWEPWKDKEINMLSASATTSGILADDISISMGKSFLYTSALGWHWHKSWNIPTIFINFKSEKCSASQKLKVILKGVIFKTESFDKKNMTEIKLNGILDQDVINGQTLFSRLTFSSTSFQNHGSKFHILISCCTLNEDNEQSLKVFQSFISPPIFVDAKNRKIEIQLKSISEKLSIRFFNPFDPKLLNSSFVRKKRLIGRSNTFNIENSLRGLYEYLSATHIRFKTKHPLFLVMKFSNCLKLLYNVELEHNVMKEGTFEEYIIKIFQQYLDNLDRKMHSNTTCGNEIHIPCSELTKKHFIILIEEPKSSDSFHLTKTIYQNFEYIKHELLHITFLPNSIPSNFVEITGTKLEKAYNACYSGLLQIKAQPRTISANLHRSNIEAIPSKAKYLSSNNHEPAIMKKPCLERNIDFETITNGNDLLFNEQRTEEMSNKLPRVNEQWQCQANSYPNFIQNDGNRSLDMVSLMKLLKDKEDQEYLQMMKSMLSNQYPPTEDWHSNSHLGLPINLNPLSQIQGRFIDNSQFQGFNNNLLQYQLYNQQLRNKCGLINGHINLTLPLQQNLILGNNNLGSMRTIQDLVINNISARAFINESFPNQNLLNRSMNLVQPLSNQANNPISELLATPSKNHINQDSMHINKDILQLYQSLINNTKNL